MARVIINHTDFVLEFENSKCREIRDKAIANGIAEESLRSAWRFDDGTQTVEVVDGDSRSVVWDCENPRQVSFPLFFDNAVQDVWLEFKDGCTKIGEPRISNSPLGMRVHNRGKSWFGPLEYGNEVGRSDFSFTYERGGVPRRYTVSYDVLSSKLDYHRDWTTLVAAVESEYRMLSYDFLKKTYTAFTDDPGGDNSDRIWWEVFARQRQEFVDACRMILDRPKTRYRRVIEYRRADQLAFVPPELENEIVEHRGEIARLYRTEIDDASRDTPENRFFKFAVGSIASRHEMLAKRVREEASRRGAGQEFLNSIASAEEELSDLRANPFFRGIGRWDGFKQVSLVLQQGVGYSDVLRIYGILDAMYSLSEGIYKLETKDIAQLYEIWCFIEVKNRVAAILGVKPGEVKHKNRGELGDMFGADMRTGKRSKILIEKGDTKLELYYNPKTTESGGSGVDGTTAPTGGAQKPDIVLQLVRRFDGKDGFKLSYLFDAKYRIGGHRDAVDTPPEDAINQMHRYRDAIYYEDRRDASAALKKEVIGGYILFPGNGRREDIEKAYFTKSIDLVNIGALPLRPGCGENQLMLQDFIKRLMEKPTEASVLSTVAQKGTVQALPDDIQTEASFLRDAPVKGIQDAAVASGYYPAPKSVTTHPEKIRWILLSLSNKPVRVLKVVENGYMGENWNGSSINSLTRNKFSRVEFDENTSYHLWRIAPLPNPEDSGT